MVSENTDDSARHPEEPVKDSDGSKPQDVGVMVSESDVIKLEESVRMVLWLSQRKTESR